jgi:hypothetical protein
MPCSLKYLGFSLSDWPSAVHVLSILISSVFTQITEGAHGQGGGVQESIIAEDGFIFLWNQRIGSAWNQQ